jgi:hypothetical protein
VKVFCIIRRKWFYVAFKKAEEMDRQSVFIVWKGGGEQNCEPKVKVYMNPAPLSWDHDSNSHPQPHRNPSPAYL